MLTLTIIILIPHLPKCVIADTNPEQILSEMEAQHLKDLVLNPIEG